MTTQTAEVIEEGLKYDRMDEALVNAAMKACGVKASRGQTLVNKVGLLLIHYRKNTAAGDIGDCDNCGAMSSLDEEACPFCGTGDGQPGAPMPLPSKEKAAKKAKIKPSTEIVKGAEQKTEPAAAELVTENSAEALEKLDRAVQDIVALKAGTDAASWLLGRKIGEVFEAKDWRHRLDDKNKPLYRTFAQFCTEEIELSASQCYRLMDVSKSFTEDQVRKLGSTKLMKVLALREDERPALVAKIEREDLSVGAVVKEVKRLAPERRDTGRRDVPAGQPGGNRRLPEGAFIVPMTTGSKSLQMFCRPRDGEDALEAQDRKKAKTVADKPMAVLDFPDGVRLIFQVIEGSTGLVLKIDTKKVDPLES